jgi:hypothetical protein
MSKKVESASPEGNNREDSEGDFQIEFEDFTAQIMKNPDLVNSMHDEKALMGDDKGRRESKGATEMFDSGTKSEKKMSLLK